MHTWPRVVPLLALLAPLGAARLCAGQEQPAEDPAITDPSVKEKAKDMERPGAAPGLRPTGTPRADPVTPGVPPESAIPGLELSDHGIARAPLRREGTFLLRQRGSMVRLRTGDWAFVFHKDDQGRAERPMIIAPCTHLSRMEHLAADRTDEVSFLLSGQLFVYLGRNYILPTLPPVLVMGERPVAAPEGERPVEAGPTGETSREPVSREDPETAALLRELEAQRDAPRSIGASAPAPKAEGPIDPLPEGTMISRRRGRLVRQADGETALIMDTDSDTAVSADPPLTLMPCLNRERMEAQASRLTEALVFEVSGRVYAYDGRNYLVPLMFQVYPSGDLSRRQ